MNASYSGQLVKLDARSVHVEFDVRNDTREEAVRRLGNKGVQAAPVLRLSEAINSRYGVGKDLIFKRSSPNGTEWHLLNTPLRLEKTPSRVTRAMGPLGCDTESVEAEWLTGVEGPKFVSSP